MLILTIILENNKKTSYFLSEIFKIIQLFDKIVDDFKQNVRSSHFFEMTILLLVLTL